MAGVSATHELIRINMDSDEKRIAEALGAQEVPEVDESKLLKYRKYLLG
jgi:hypothetical protein